MQDALSYYNNLGLVGFSSSSYIATQLAMVHFHLKSELLKPSLLETEIIIACYCCYINSISLVNCCVILSQVP